MYIRPPYRFVPPSAATIQSLPTLATTFRPVNCPFRSVQSQRPFKGDEAAALARRAAAFAPLSEATAPELNKGIRRILERKPLLLDEKGRPIMRAQPSEEQVHLLSKGEFSFPRIEAIHRLLCGGRDPRHVKAIDNGPGSHPILSCVLARMGSSVVVKETAPARAELHVAAIERTIPRTASRVSHLVRSSDVDKLSFADIVYWTNPDPWMLIADDIAEDFGTDAIDFGELAAYMGRDVTNGGFLVVQTDSYSVKLEWDRYIWEEITRLSMNCDDVKNITGLVVPTNFYDKGNSLIVLRRRITPKRISRILGFSL